MVLREMEGGLIATQEPRQLMWGSLVTNRHIKINNTTEVIRTVQLPLLLM